MRLPVPLPLMMITSELPDLTFQMTLLEVMTGLGGLAVVIAGAGLANAGALESGLLPVLTLLAMSAFLPVSEISNVGRQLADTLGSTRRLYAAAPGCILLVPRP